MRVAIYTLTRERLDYTKHCFALLKEKAGIEYDHFIVDNGSEDGTREWLSGQRFKQVILLPQNVGISVASNMALKNIYNAGPYDFIVKMDNDCEIVTNDILLKITNISSHAIGEGKYYVLSPRVEGLYRQPKRYDYTTINGWKIGLTGIVGGLFHVVPYLVMQHFYYPENLAFARGQDETFCEWANKSGFKTGYVEDIQVNHYETTRGQAERYPEYFERKYIEEKI